MYFHYNDGLEFSALREKRLLNFAGPEKNNKEHGPMTEKAMKMLDELMNEESNKEGIKEGIQRSLMADGKIDEQDCLRHVNDLQTRLMRLNSVDDATGAQIKEVINSLPKTPEAIVNFAVERGLFNAAELMAAQEQGILRAKRTGGTPASGRKATEGRMSPMEYRQERPMNGYDPKTKEVIRNGQRIPMADFRAYMQSDRANLGPYEVRRNTVTGQGYTEKEWKNLQTLRKYNGMRGGGGDMARDYFERKANTERYAGVPLGYVPRTGNDDLFDAHLERNAQRGGINFKRGNSVYSDMPIARTATNKNGDVINRAQQYEGYMAQNGEKIFGTPERFMSDAVDPATRTTIDAYGSAKRRKESDRQFETRRNPSFNKTDTNTAETQRELNNRYAAEKRVALETKIQLMTEKYFVVTKNNDDGTKEGYSLMKRSKTYPKFESWMRSLAMNTGGDTGYNGASELQRALDLADIVDAETKVIKEAIAVEEEKIQDVRAKSNGRWIEGKGIKHGLENFQYITGKEDNKVYAFDGNTGNILVYKEGGLWAKVSEAEITMAGLAKPAFAAPVRPKAAPVDPEIGNINARNETFNTVMREWGVPLLNPQNLPDFAQENGMMTWTEGGTFRAFKNIEAGKDGSQFLFFVAEGMKPQGVLIDAKGKRLNLRPEQTIPFETFVNAANSRIQSLRKAKKDAQKVDAQPQPKPAPAPVEAPNKLPEAPKPDTPMPPPAPEPPRPAPAPTPAPPVPNPEPLPAPTPAETPEQKITSLVREITELSNQLKEKSDLYLRILPKAKNSSDAADLAVLTIEKDEALAKTVLQKFTELEAVDANNQTVKNTVKQYKHLPSLLLNYINEVKELRTEFAAKKAAEVKPAPAVPPPAPAPNIGDEIRKATEDIQTPDTLDERMVKAAQSDRFIDLFKNEYRDSAITVDWYKGDTQKAMLWQKFAKGYVDMVEGVDNLDLKSHSEAAYLGKMITDENLQIMLESPFKSFFLERVRILSATIPDMAKPEDLLQRYKRNEIRKANDDIQKIDDETPVTETPKKSPSPRSRRRTRSTTESQPEAKTEEPAEMETRTSKTFEIDED